jgi:RNA polymerase sigma-70 factor (ECF subfamily)
MEEACYPIPRCSAAAGSRSVRGNQKPDVRWRVGIPVMGRLPDAAGAPRRYGRTIVTKISLRYASLAATKGGLGLQFTAFDPFYLEQLQRGDARTAAHFTAYFSELIRIKLRSRLRSREAIEDVRQETFVRVLALVRAKDGIKHPERLGALVNSVCNHVLLEHYRSQRRTDTSLDEQPEGALIATEASAPELLEVDDAERVVRRILGDLSERDRGLLQSVLLDERDKDKVCAELGFSREHLRVLVHRAKQSFKSYYIKHLGETK